MLLLVLVVGIAIAPAAMAWTGYYSYDFNNFNYWSSHDFNFTTYHDYDFRYPYTFSGTYDCGGFTFDCYYPSKECEVIPEPASIVLLGMGSAGLLLQSMRKRRAAEPKAKQAE